VTAQRPKNLKRRVMANILPLVEYLKDNVGACNACSGQRGVDFVPFASTEGLLPADIYDMSILIVAWARAAGATSDADVTRGANTRARVLATCAAATLGWTHAFVECFGGLIEVPFTGDCAKRIEGNIMHAWREGRHVITVGFQAALTLSLGTTATTARMKARRIVQLIRSAARMAHRISETRYPTFGGFINDFACDGVAAHGYRQALACALWSAAGGVPAPDATAMAKLPHGRSMPAMVAHLCGGVAADYKPKLVRLRMELIRDCVKEAWPHHGAELAMPEFGVMDLMPQLCMWKRGGCGNIVVRPSPAIVSQMSRLRGDSAR
jgi:hypothetical protein